MSFDAARFFSDPYTWLVAFIVLVMGVNTVYLLAEGMTRAHQELEDEQDREE